VDRIRKALDLARQERTRSAVAEANPQPALDAELPAKVMASQAPAVIVYTETQMFQPDPGRLEANRIVNPSSHDAAAAAFRMLRTQVMQRMDEHGWRSVAILSPAAHDGKTTTAVNLAVSLAHDRHHTVLLVDCDLRQPSIAETFGITPQFGVDDVLRGDANVGQCLYHPEAFERLVVLPARSALAHSSDALAGPRGRALVSELRGRYPERIIVFDLPPVLSADDALAFLPLVECGLVVVAERATRRDELLRCMELLRKTPIVGTVLNKATDVKSGYG
jgi:protein-tyrosine kinase